MQSNKQKKFTHNRMKACIDRSDNPDKENIMRYDDFRNKKLSVELPPKSIDFNEPHQKSIFNEQISVTLNTSNPRNSTFDRDLITIDVKTLSHLLNRHQSNTPLRQILAESDLKSIEVRLLIERMLNYLKREQKFASSMISQKEQQDSHEQLSSTLMKPYIEKQIDVLSKNLEKLMQEKEDYLSIGTIGKENKTVILNSLKELYIKQIKQLSTLS